MSESGIDLIRRLLVVDPAKRITADEIQEHNWISGKAKVSKLNML